MNRLTAIRLLAKPDLDRFFDQTISRGRWATIAALLPVALAQPSTGGTRVREWVLILLFAGYNLLVEVVQRRTGARRGYAWIAFLDLPAVGLVYVFGSDVGGPMFVLLVLAAAQTAAFMTLAGSLLYTVGLGGIVMVVEPTLPGWDASVVDARGLASRLVMLAVVGVGMGTMTRRLVTEQAAGRVVLGEAARLGEMDRLRSNFVASVSHELRTPLTAARAGLGLLEGSAADRLGTAEQDLLANARRNVERLNVLIADLLTANQLGAGTLRLDLTAIDLRAVVADAMAAVHPLIHMKGQQLEIDLDEPLLVHGDPGRLEQVVLNVIANAHHHTPNGTRIILSGRRTTDQILLVIQDNGPGIPESELVTIFNRFYRLGTGGGGSGLGLAVARGIVEMHGGTIRANSRPGQGATFHITLPLADGSGAA